eukprot:scaffold3127_cov202-Prasinococcus_capsulatus_cf.AAC.7
MEAWMRPISVNMPVELTMAIHWPLATAVPQKSMFSLAWISQSEGSSAAASLATATLSPVSELCSTRSVAVRSSATRKSAGTRWPTRSITTSPAPHASQSG